MEHKEAFEEIDVKHIERYTSEEKNHYEGISVVLGYLARTFNKITLTHFNKIWVELGNERIQRDDLEFYMDVVKEEDVFSQLFEDAIDGKVSIEDIPNYEGEAITKDKTIKDIISPYQVQHQRTLANNREFSKVQREGAYLKMLMDDLKEHMTTELSAWEVPVNFYPKTEETSGTLFVFVSDWHIGASVNKSYDHGGYNFSILQKRLNKVLLEAREAADRYKPEQIVCLFGGDLVEGANMRGNQVWGLEFTLAEQIAKGTTTMLDFLSSLEEIAPVTFGAVKGNHDRLTGQSNKKDQLYNDHAVYVVVDTLITMQDAGVLPNTEIIDNREDMTDLTLDVYGKRVLVNHGEGLKATESQNRRFVRDASVNYLITAHIHHSKIMQGDRDYLHIVVGSPMGYNDYAKSLNLSHTDPSQTLMYLPKEGDPTIKTVFLAGVE